MPALRVGIVTPDGISTEDWDKVHELAVRVVNLSAEGLDAESDAARGELLTLLDVLDLKYGRKPSLLATRADYIDSAPEKEQCLRQAFAAAKELDDRQNLTWVAASLASFYLEDVSDIPNGASWVMTLRGLLAEAPDVSMQPELERLEKLLISRVP